MSSGVFSTSCFKTITNGPPNCLTPTSYEDNLRGCPDQIRLSVPEKWTLSTDITYCKKIHRSVCMTSNRQQVPFCRCILFWQQWLWFSERCDSPFHTSCFFNIGFHVTFYNERLIPILFVIKKTPRVSETFQVFSPLSWLVWVKVMVRRSFYTRSLTGVSRRKREKTVRFFFGKNWTPAKIK